jgi:hypothetical protein
MLGARSQPPLMARISENGLKTFRTRAKRVRKTEGEVRVGPSRRRVGGGRFLEPLDHLRRRYHTFRQMRIERARADILGLG